MLSVEGGEGGLTAGRQEEMALPSVRLRRSALEEPALLEETEDAAQVARIQPQLPSELGGGGPLAMRELVEHAHLAQRELALMLDCVN